MLAFLLLASLAVQDPVRVNTRLTQDPVAAGETTILRVEVETGGERARIARFTRLPPGVELVSTRDFDQRQFSLPGGTRRFVTREFVLRALSAGRYRIPALDVEVDGRAFSTESVILTVTSAASQGTGEGD
ncbi:MAG TPA: BatD family protein, partial [Longimicrobiales bacterium]|nr:BatD family protein [Longimicrobiales bacterium]